jgi:branched-chain amino acid aminotransferase
MILWLNGALVPASEARIDPADRGLLLGDGLFETMQAQDGRVLRLPRHLARLRTGAEVLGFPVGIDDDAFREAIALTLQANGQASGGAALRLTLTRGPGPRGLLPPSAPMPTMMLAAFPMPPERPPAQAVVVTGTARNPRSPVSRLKALGYLDNILALREAQARGADEAILPNTAGRLACASAANLFLVIGDRLVTPPVGDGALPGVTRGRVIEIAAALRLAYKVLSLPTEAAASAQEGFLSSSLQLIRPLASLEGRAMQAPGPVTRMIADVIRAEPG